MYAFMKYTAVQSILEIWLSWPYGTTMASKVLTGTSSKSLLKILSRICSSKSKKILWFLLEFSKSRVNCNNILSSLQIQNIFLYFSAFSQWTIGYHWQKDFVRQAVHWLLKHNLDKQNQRYLFKARLKFELL